MQKSEKKKKKVYLNFSLHILLKILLTGRWPWSSSAVFDPAPQDSEALLVFIRVNESRNESHVGQQVTAVNQVVW